MNEIWEFIVGNKVLLSLIIVILSIIIFYIIKEAALKYIQKKRRHASKLKRKALTLLYLLLSTLKYAVFLVDIILILGIFGLDVTGFLAGLGLFGIVIGLSLQDLLKDFISGIFIILDEQYSVGDYVEIDSFKGEVVGIGLKSTKIRDYSGDVMIIANRKIGEVKNLSKMNSKVISVFSFSSDMSLIKLEKAMKVLISQLNKNKKIKEDIVREFEYKGVEDYGDSTISLKITADVKPHAQKIAEAEVLRCAKLVFDAAKIQIK